ncbi:MAG TPA: cyanophycin synthetase, partial [Acidimicrobiales bacterium]|nr:cyanophycin synthetase [Acidimicrobiales bacterium]
LLTAAAFRWFADIAVDVAVVEVGMGGRWDATNVADGVVAVVTNVALDHAEVIGPTLAEIATEKAGIVKPGATLVLGVTDPDLRSPFLARRAGVVWERERDFGCDVNEVAHGGRLLNLRTAAATYDGVFLGLHGAHQGDNAACALAAAEGFFGRPLDREVVQEALASVQVPGRCEVVGRQPLLILDGAHNPAGARALTRTLDEDFGVPAADVLIVGFTAGRDPAEMLVELRAGQARRVLTVRPPHPRGLDPEEVAAAARRLGVEAEPVSSISAALESARVLAGEHGFVLVTGSLYVVGDARRRLH